MSKNDVKDLVKYLDGKFLEINRKIEDVKEEIAEVKADVRDLKGRLGDPDEASTIGG